MIQRKRHITTGTLGHWSLLEPGINSESSMDQDICNNVKKRETHCFVE